MFAAVFTISIGIYNAFEKTLLLGNPRSFESSQKLLYLL